MSLYMNGKLTKAGILQRIENCLAHIELCKTFNFTRYPTWPSEMIEEHGRYISEYGTRLLNGDYEDETLSN